MRGAPVSDLGAAMRATSAASVVMDDMWSSSSGRQRFSA
jgi:hypothetical protein